MLEREVKLRFDTEDGRLRQRGCALRLRHENGTGVVTFKGPVLSSAMKLRPEFETAVAEPDSMRTVLEELGYRPWFTYEKYREEYSLPGVIVAIDETPIGTFVEVEGGEDEILAVTRQLGRTPDQFVLGSYRTLFVESAGRGGDMVFEAK